jgi:hypothetical protein
VEHAKRRAEDAGYICMKEICGHKSWNKDEIIEILERTGTFTCPTLPHYRYARVKNACRDLQKRGFLKRSGRTEVSVNLIVTDLWQQWKNEKTLGITTLGPIKWQKQRKKNND